MVKLLVICFTVLALALVREGGKTFRHAMELEDRYNARVFSEYQRQRSRPSLQIIPERESSRKDWKL